MDYKEFQDRNKTATVPLPVEETIYEKHKKWVLRLFQEQIKANEMGKVSIDVQHLCTRYIGFRFLCYQCYMQDVKDGLMIPVNKLPMEKQILIKDYAIAESNGALQPWQVKELGKCFYWFDEIIAVHINGLV